MESSSVVSTSPVRASLPRRAYGALFGKVLFPAWERVIKQRATLEYLAHVEASQWRSAEEIERAQVASLKRLLTSAGKNVPYYRELFAKLGFDPRGITSRSDLAELPLLTRDIVRERYADLLDPAHRGKTIKKGTSGSTGAPLKFEYSLESECWRQALRIRGYGWAGYAPGRPVFYYWARVAAIPSGAAGMKIRVDRALKRETFFDSMDQSEESRRHALDIIRKTRPQVIVCYTQSCAQFARWILDRGVRDWDDIPVLCGAEAVLPGDRAVLAKAFGPQVFETYGSRETMLIAAECPAHDGMHLSEETLVVEIVEGKRAAPVGTAGDVIITDLENYAMPFIRYVNGDMATMASVDRCSCGRGLRRLARVEGRRADTLLDREGNPIPGIVFHVLFSDTKKELVKQFQATQKASGEVILKIVRGRDWSEDGFETIRRRFTEYLRGLPLTVTHCDGLPPSQNGKMRTVVVERV